MIHKTDLCKACQRYSRSCFKPLRTTRGCLYKYELINPKKPKIRRKGIVSSSYSEFLLPNHLTFDFFMMIYTS